MTSTRSHENLHKQTRMKCPQDGNASCISTTSLVLNSLKMETLQIWDSIVCYDDYKLEGKLELQAYLKRENLDRVLASTQKEVILVLWWDGTMLRAIRENHDRRKAFLWINFWTKGFLLNDASWITEENHFIERSYPLLWVSQNKKRIGVGFNDIHLYSPEWKFIELDILLDDRWELNLSWDWAIIATPAGSTGHSKSYFWPVIPHVISSLIVTPKGNTTPEAAKLISDTTAITIHSGWRRFPLAVNIDWVQVSISKHDEPVELEVRKLQESITLLIEWNHTQDWDEKVMQQQWFRL